MLPRSEERSQAQVPSVEHLTNSETEEGVQAPPETPQMSPNNSETETRTSSCGKLNHFVLVSKCKK